MPNFVIPYSVVCELLWNSGCSLEQGLQEKYPELQGEQLILVSEEIKRRFQPNFKKKLKEVHFIKQQFLRKYNDWLKGEFTVIFPELDVSSENVASSFPSSGGRPKKSFEESGKRSEQYKIKMLREDYSDELIIAAAEQIKKERTTDPVRFIGLPKALALMLDASLTKYQYELLRKCVKDVGYNVFPPYKQLLEIKKQCYPTSLEVTKTCAKVSLQGLLDHTAMKILQTKTEADLYMIGSALTLSSKWGCDGSSGLSQYKQTLTDDNVSDANMFLTSIVPLFLTEKQDTSIIHWENPRPFSTRFCRPIKFEFIKETPKVKRTEVERVEREISNLTPSVINLTGKTVIVTHALLFTMIDGKVAQTVAGASSMAVCCVCNARPSEFNDLNLVKKKPEANKAIEMHSRIKFMECVLHISYNKPFQAWRVNPETKALKEETKKKIQQEFKRILGLNVDVIKQGMGTTNGGNTSSRFFQNPSITAQITGIDENLIHRFGIILDAINCNAPIDPDKFGRYCEETAQLYVQLYNWYKMPNTVHKVLVHGKNIISAATLPIGKLTEEAQEARNKDYRKFRLGHARKCSRQSTNEDVMNMLLVTSDPYIYTFRAEPKSKKLDLHEDIKSMLM